MQELKAQLEKKDMFAWQEDTGTIHLSQILRQLYSYTEIPEDSQKDQTLLAELLSTNLLCHPLILRLMVVIMTLQGNVPNCCICSSVSGVLTKLSISRRTFSLLTFFCQLIQHGVEATFRILPQEAGEAPGEALDDAAFEGNDGDLIDGFFFFKNPDQLPQQLRFADASDALDQAFAAVGCDFQQIEQFLLPAEKLMLRQNVILQQSGMDAQKGYARSIFLGVIVFLPQGFNAVFLLPEHRHCRIVHRFARNCVKHQQCQQVGGQE